MRESAEYREGRKAGLREAYEMAQAAVDQAMRKLEQPSPVITRRAREVRWQAYINLRNRIGSRLRKCGGGALQIEIINAALRRLAL